MELMKNLAYRIAVALLVVGLSSPAFGEDAAKACKSTSTSGRCLLNMIVGLQGQVAALQGQVTTLQSSNSTLTSQISLLQTALTNVQNNNALALGPYVSIVSGIENGLKGPHLIIKGANVHIESGSGTTVDSTGLGNLVVGYDEDSLAASTIDANRTGSHNLVIGPYHEFISSGGFISGYANFTSTDYASVTGGLCNDAGPVEYPFLCGYPGGAYDASVSGGYGNWASGEFSSVSGGEQNTASGGASSVLGGLKITIDTPNGTSPVTP